MRPTSVIRTRIDWQAVHARLEANERALARALTPDVHRIEETLRTRAAQLAQAGIDTQKTAAQKASAAGMPVLVFGLGQERYAIEVRQVAEVLPFGYCAPVPRCPAPFLGVISVRGELRAVVDLAGLLDASVSNAPFPGASSPGASLPDALGERAAGSGFVLMLHAEAGCEQIGLKVDQVEALREIRPEELAGSTAGGCLTRLAGERLAVLKLDAVLAQVLSNHSNYGISNGLAGGLVAPEL